MKKLFLLLILIAAVGLGFFVSRSGPIVSPITTQSLSPSLRPEQKISRNEERTSVFVPYWGIHKETVFESDDTVIYFGVTPGTSGLNTNEPGYKALPLFVEKAAGTTAYLTLRMLDSKQNFMILENTVLQDALIADTIRTAKANNFSGIVLDLEVSALPFASVIEQISSFNKRFYQVTKKAKLHYGTALYGDTFFRIRPFDVKHIAENSDEIFIMAYDFHKSRGSPGPNFPLGGKDKYGYDYSRLIKQFSDVVPSEKLTVTFGLFGYDWVIDEKNNTVVHGTPLSYQKIKSEFITDCPYSPCTLKRDNLSSESFVRYTDDEGAHHIVWFEDMNSVAKKREFLKTKGILSYSFWAYSYY